MLEAALYRWFVPEIIRFPAPRRRRAWRMMFNSAGVLGPWWALMMFSMGVFGACVGFWGLPLKHPPVLYPSMATLFCILHLAFIALWRRRLSRILADMLKWEGCCDACGYDLRGYTTNICSECGKKFDMSTSMKIEK